MLQMNKFYLPFRYYFLQKRKKKKGIKFRRSYLPLFWKRAYFHGLVLDVHIAPESINLKGFELLNSFSRKLSKSEY